MHGVNVRSRKDDTVYPIALVGPYCKRSTVNLDGACQHKLAVSPVAHRPCYTAKLRPLGVVPARNTSNSRNTAR